jgi:hypothetical protein
VAIERPDADTGSFCYSLETRVRTTGTEDGLRGLKHPLAITNRVGAGPANSLCGLICHLLGPDHDPVRLNRIMISSLCLCSNIIFGQTRSEGKLVPSFRNHALVSFPL